MAAPSWPLVDPNPTVLSRSGAAANNCTPPSNGHRTRCAHHGCEAAGDGSPVELRDAIGCERRRELAFAEVPQLRGEIRSNAFFVARKQAIADAMALDEAREGAVGRKRERRP